MMINISGLSCAECNHWFHSSDESWGYPKFMLLSKLEDKKTRFLKCDALVVEAEFLVVGMLKDFN